MTQGAVVLPPSSVMTQGAVVPPSFLELAAIPIPQVRQGSRTGQGVCAGSDHGNKDGSRRERSVSPLSIG